MQFLTANNVRVVIRRRGSPLATQLYEQGTFSAGLGVETVNLTGRAHGVPRGTSENPRLSVSGGPAGASHLDLLHEQRQKNAGAEEALGMVIDVEAEVDFRPLGGTIQSVLMPDCVVHGATVGWGGGQERVSAALEFTSEDWRPL